MVIPLLHPAILEWDAKGNPKNNLRFTASDMCLFARHRSALRGVICAPVV